MTQNIISTVINNALQIKDFFPWDLYSKH